jgi:hypothetical protein
VTLRFPNMRLNLKDALHTLVELDAAPVGGPRWPGLTEGIAWLDDNAPEPASESIGATLEDAEEARLVQRVHDAWNAVLAETANDGGATAPDHVHLAAPSWPSVAAAAAEALRRIEAADAARATANPGSSTERNRGSTFMP